MTLIVNQINYGLIKGREFYNNIMQKWLVHNNEGKSVVVENFIKVLKDKTYKKVTASDSNVILVILDQCNTTYHCLIVKNRVDADHFCFD